MIIEHGGGLDQAIALYGGTKNQWLDLSTGINPEAYALPVIEPQLWNRLPDAGLLQETLASARHYYGVSDDAPIVAAPGTQALIQIAPELLKPATVAILSPTYQEHAACFRSAGWRVVECQTVEDIPAEALVAVIVNPNNPDGRVVPPTHLQALSRKLGARGGFLIVDEAFADAHEGISVAAFAATEPLIVLKSFGKFFGLAGLRLGFALCNEAIAAKLRARLGPWAVSGPALTIAKAAFSGGPEFDAFNRRVDQRRAALSAVLARAGLEEVGGTALFALVQHAQAHALFEALAQQHILLRKFDYAPNWLRIGLADDEAAFVRLEQALIQTQG